MTVQSVFVKKKFFLMVYLKHVRITHLEFELEMFDLYIKNLCGI